MDELYILFEFSEQRATAKQNPRPGGVELEIATHSSTTLVCDCVGVRSVQVHLVEENFSVFISAYSDGGERGSGVKKIVFFFRIAIKKKVFEVSRQTKVG